MYGYIARIQIPFSKPYIVAIQSEKYKRSYIPIYNDEVVRAIDYAKELYGDDWKKFVIISCIKKCDTQKELDDWEIMAIEDEQKKSIDPISDLHIVKIQHKEYGALKLIRRKKFDNKG